MSERSTPSRRDVLTAAAATVVTLAPGLTLYAQPAQAASAGRRWGLLIDAERCSADCTVCVDACSDEFGLINYHRTGDAGQWLVKYDTQWIRKVTVTDKSTGLTRSFPVMCQHCDRPPCVNVCPTGATLKRADGPVVVDAHLCIGCRYCIMACPFKARNFVHEEIDDQKPYGARGKGTAEACTLCVHRIDAGRPPACVEACAGKGKGAMLFGDLNDPKSEIAKRLATVATSQLRPGLRNDPAIRYRGI